jgi:tetratricopeptide (TPR) repeat protein
VDPTVSYQPAASTTEPYAAEPSAQTMANDQVVVGDIPAQRAGFQPRPALLAQLNPARQGPSVVVLTGTWGVGKTQLAASYARARLAGGWRLIAWVNARDSESLLAGLAAVAEAIAPPDGGSRPGLAEAGYALRRWLEADGSRCLLVFDDAQDLGLLQPFVPSVGAARVLITVAREPALELGTSVPVDVFSAEEARALLDGRTGLADEAGASAVAAELGHLPLALDQAAAVIAGQHLAYTAYLAKLRALPVEDYLIRKEDGEDQPYPPGVAEAVLLSVEAASASDPLGVCTAVMEVMAMLAPAMVRRDVLRAAGQAGTLLGRGRRVAAAVVDQALARLNERSLLGFSLDGQAVTVHCLVARVVRGELARRERLATACAAAAAASEASAEALAKPWDRTAVGEMLGQVTALLENAGADPDDADEKLAGTLMRLRFLALHHLIELGDGMPPASVIGEPLIADLQRVLGPDHLETLNARNSLAVAYQAAGRAVDAIPLFEHVLVAQERVLGPKHPDTLTSQNNLAATYQDVGRFAEAILLFKLTLAAREGLLGADHPSTLNSRDNLAAAYRATGRVSEAIRLLEQTPAGREQMLGAGHLDVQAARDNLAAAQQKTDRTDETPPPAPPAVDTAHDPVPEPPAAPADEEPPPAAPAAETVDKPTPVPERETEQEPPEGLSEPAPPPAEEPPAAPPAEEQPAATVDEGPLVAAPAAETDDDPSPEPAPTPEPEPEPETPDDVSEAGPPATAVAEAPPAEEPPGVPVAEPRAVPAAEPPAPSRDRLPWRQWRVPSLVAAIVVLLAAGGVGVALSLPHPGHSGHGPATATRPVGGQSGGTASQLAAAWVAQQVARSAIVACDPLMCSALEAQGVPAANLLILQTGSTSPLRAQVVVVTPAVRSQFGSRLDSVYAPSVIAGFGSGPDQVSVQVIAQNGPTAYLTALRQDVAARKAAGAQLLANKRIGVSAEARAQLGAGAVDSRLLIMLPALAVQHPIQILGFGQPAPGAGPGVPLCSVDLSGSGRAAGMINASYLSWLTSFVRAQLIPFAGSMAVLQQAGQPVVRVEFAQPSPLGLLSHT